MSPFDLLPRNASQRTAPSSAHLLSAPRTRSTDAVEGRRPAAGGVAPARHPVAVVRDLEPMLATPGIPVSLGGWVAEPKFDGWRARVAISGGTVVVRTRPGRVITEAVPELTHLAEHADGLLLDGELVTGAGRLSDFYGLSGRLAGRRRSTTAPLVFIAFDVLVFDAEPIIDQPYAARRQVLGGLDLPGVVVTPAYPAEDAPALFGACEEAGMEGLVLKKLDSPYLPGTRTTAWRKVKCSAWQEHGRARFGQQRLRD